MKKKKGLIIFIVIVVMFAGGIVLYNYINRFKYNDDTATGNTTGNLYNQGLFCEYNDGIFFANPYDEDALYFMNKDCTEFEKYSEDDASYICACGDYVYYKKFNSEQKKDQLFQRVRYGIVRMKESKKTTDIIHNGKIDSMVQLGNYIYYRYYDDEELFSLRKVKIDGKEDVLITDKDYQPIAAYEDKIYMINVEGNRNLMVLDTADDSIRQVAEGNFYMPDVFEGNVYFIDLNDDRKLKKMSLSSQEVTTLTNDKVINYNLGGKYGVIYYQVENSVDEHRLCRMNLNGTGAEVVALGDYYNINITEKYTFFYEKVMDVLSVHKTPTTGSVEVSEFIPPILTD